jgi:hypothetical protein
MSKELTKKENTDLALASDLEQWGQGSNLTSDAYELPRILLMQSNSPLVIERKAALGDFLETMGMSVIGSNKKPFELIPFYIEEKWLIKRKEGNQFKTKQIIDVTPANTSLAWEEEDGEGPIRRDRTLFVYCLLPEKLNNGVIIPFTIGFKRTSHKAGKYIATRMDKYNRAENLCPAAYTIKISGKITEKNGGTYLVAEAETGRRTTQEELKVALEMLKQVRSSKMVAQYVDDDFEGKEEDTSYRGNY